MKTIIPVLLFFAANFIGFTLISVSFAVARIYEFVDTENTNFLLNQETDMLVVMFMWIACAVFSFTSFFKTGKWKIFFLSAPIIVPFIFSIILISAYT